MAEAFALAIIADGEAPTYSGLARPTVDLAAARQDARAIDLATAELRKIIPNAGSYVSESNFFNQSWQSAYWGENYSKLRAVKTDMNPLLLKVNFGAGHGGSSGRYDALRETAFNWAFLLSQLGVGR